LFTNTPDDIKERKDARAEK